MKWVWAVGVIGAIIVVWLAFTVVQDVEADPIGPCQAVDGAVCSPGAQCPSGFAPEARRSCEPAGYLCCVPTTD